MKSNKKLIVLAATIAVASVPFTANLNGRNVENSTQVLDVASPKKKTETTPVINEMVNVNADFVKVDKSLSEYEFFYSGKDLKYVVIKQAQKMLVWTEKELTNKEEFVSSLMANNKDKALNVDKFEQLLKDDAFVYGEGTHSFTELGNPYGEYTFAINGDMVVMTCDSEKISHANYGSYTDKGIVVEEPKTELTWDDGVAYPDHDSVSAYLEGGVNYNIMPQTGNWFAGQKLNFADTDKIVLDFHPGRNGNPKAEGAVFGKITLTKVVEDSKTFVEISYTEDSLPTDMSKYSVGDTYVLSVLSSDYKYDVSFSGEDINVQAPGKLTRSDNKFELEADEFDFAIHFNANYVTYTVVEK